jgi:hypothetical protein
MRKAHTVLLLLAYGEKAFHFLSFVGFEKRATLKQTLTVYVVKICTVACRPIAKQRHRKKQLYNIHYWVTTSQTSMFARQQLESATEEWCFLCGPCRDVKSCVVNESQKQAFNMLCVYDHVTKLCRKQAEFIQNHENKHVRGVGQGEARHRKVLNLVAVKLTTVQVT